MTFKARVQSKLRETARKPALALSLAAFGVSLVISARIHAFFFAHPGPVGSDDGYTMSQGIRLVQGHFLPYVDGCSHRGPGLYWAAAVAQKLAGRFEWMGAKILNATTTIGTLLGVFGVGIAARRPVAGAVGAAFAGWAIFAALAASPGFAITGEGVASPACIFSLFFATLALARARSPRARYAFLFVSGVVAGLAGLAKQTALPIVVPLSFWVFVEAGRPPSSFRERCMRVGALGAGVSLVALFIVVLYGAHGELRTFWYWYYEYNLQVYMEPYLKVSRLDAISHYVMFDQPWAVGTFAFGIGTALASGIAGVRFRSSGPAVESPATGSTAGDETPDVSLSSIAAGIEGVSALLALALFSAAVSALRFWPHYFLCVMPFAALMVGFAADRALQGSSRLANTLGSVVVLSVATGFFAYGVDRRLGQFRGEARGGSWPVRMRESVCDTIRASTGPDDPMFVWGFAGDLYLTCRRAPASRYTYLTLVAGVVPPEWSTVRENRVARGARENLVRDLTESRPPVIVDAPDSLGHVSMTQIPVVSTFLRSHYCETKNKAKTRLDGEVTLWLRKDLPGCTDAR